MKYDLHVHSKYSDGSFTLSELCQLAKESGIDGFALTDHDTVAGWREIPFVAAKYAITIIPSVEISTEYAERDVHILAYGLGESKPHIDRLLSRLYASRVNRVKEMVAKLNDLGLAITATDVFREAAGGSPGRPHVAKVLIKNGYVDSLYQAFNRYLGRGCPGYVPREKLTPRQCVEIIRSDKGLPVLAHPGLDEAYRLVPQLVEDGIWGLEAYHSSHSPGQEIKFKALAEKYNLQITGGSDFHSCDDGKHGNIGSKFIVTNSIDEFFAKQGGTDNVERV